MLLYLVQPVVELSKIVRIIGRRKKVELGLARLLILVEIVKGHYSGSYTVENLRRLVLCLESTLVCRLRFGQNGVERALKLLDLLVCLTLHLDDAIHSVRKVKS